MRPGLCAPVVNAAARPPQAVRAAGGVCIADEVQTGFGRTGSHFWGFQRQASMLPACRPACRPACVY